MAPLQGFTDYVFRAVFSKHFGGVDAYFIPYISLKNGEYIKKQLKEVLPENNLQEKVVPQVLFKDSSEFMYLYSLLKNHVYRELNINLGCPYPMVHKRGKGSGLLPYPKKIKAILDECLPKIDGKVSIKLRSGLKDENEIEPVIEVLNQYDLSEIIYHPRLAMQLYKGAVNDQLFGKIQSLAKHRFVFNGDIFSLDSFKERQLQFPNTEAWMLGRGLLMNPFLAEEIKGREYVSDERALRLKEFHKDLFDMYSEKLSGSGHVLVKMKQFWSYFSYSFNNQHKVFKLIKKSTSIEKYNSTVNEIFLKFL